MAGNVQERYTSLPFGDLLTTWDDNWQSTSPAIGAISPLHFTGQPRDPETGLDDFGFRYNASTLGRFLTPDPAGNLVASPADPQSWNQYAYVMNNPTTWTDPNGLLLLPGGTAVSAGGGFGSGWNEFDAMSIPVTSQQWGWIPVNVPASPGPYLAGPTWDATTSVGVTDYWGVIDETVGYGFDVVGWGLGQPSESRGTTAGAGERASHPHFAPTAGMYWTAFWQNFVSYGNLPDCSVFALELTGENLLGGSDTPPGGDPVDTGLRGAAMVQANLAASYAARKALVSPFRSSTFRAMIGTAEVITDVADGIALANLDYALGQGTIGASKAAWEGQCH